MRRSLSLVAVESSLSGSRLWAQISSDHLITSVRLEGRYRLILPWVDFHGACRLDNETVQQGGTLRRVGSAGKS